MKATTLDTPRVCDVRHLKMGSVPDLYLGLEFVEADGAARKVIPSFHCDSEHRCSREFAR
jgi:hypothetical protein